MDFFNLRKTSVLIRNVETPETSNIRSAGLAPLAPVSNEVIDNCFFDPKEENQFRMAALLRILEMQGDPRLIPIALKCAKSEAFHEIKLQLYKILIRKKDVPEIESLLIDYLVHCDDDLSDPIFQILQSCWS